MDNKVYKYTVEVRVPDLIRMYWLFPDRGNAQYNSQLN